MNEDIRNVYLEVVPKNLGHFHCSVKLRVLTVLSRKMASSAGIH